MVDLLASYPIVAVPAPAIDVFALKPGARNSQTIVPTEAHEPIRVVIRNPIAKGTNDLVFGDAVGAGYSIEVTQADADIAAVDALKDPAQIAIESILVCHHAVLSRSISDHYGEETVPVCEAAQ